MYVCTMEEKETVIQKQKEVLMELRMSYEAQIEEVKAENENKSKFYLNFQHRICIPLDNIRF